MGFCEIDESESCEREGKKKKVKSGSERERVQTQNTRGKKPNLPPPNNKTTIQYMRVNHVKKEFDQFMIE